MRHDEIYPTEDCPGRVLESKDTSGQVIFVCLECGMVMETDEA